MSLLKLKFVDSATNVLDFVDKFDELLHFREVTGYYGELDRFYRDYEDYNDEEIIHDILNLRPGRWWAVYNEADDDYLIYELEAD